MMNKQALCTVLVTLALAGCDSGKWVDLPLGTPYICNAKGFVDDQLKEQEKAKKNGLGVLANESGDQIKQNAEDMIKLQAQSTCSRAGAAYTGDTRCENGAGQIKCK